MRLFFVNHRLICGTLLLTLASASGELDPERFANPPDSARPMTWMHMMNGNASKAGLEKDLQRLADGGVGGALIFSISRTIPKGAETFNSPEWREIMVAGAKEADRLGLTIGLHNCDGWSSSGGPWVTPEDAMKKVVWSETVVSGGPVNLARPGARQSFYHDLAVVAFPATKRELGNHQNKVKISCSDAEQNLKELLDDDLGTTPKVKWIQWDYEKPFPLSSIYIEHMERHGKAVLYASENGKDFKKIVDLGPEQRQAKSIWTFEASFNEVKARTFRLEFQKPGRVISMDLKPFRRAPNWLGQAYVTKVTKNLLSQNLEGVPFIPKKDILVFDPKEALSGNQFTAELPAGTWRVMRFGYTLTGAINTPATNAGRGLECDKLNAEALDRHFAAYVGKVANQCGDLAGKSFLFSEIDSYEMGFQTWTKDFESIFEKEKGYDLYPFLPLLAGRLVEDVNTSDAVYDDYRNLVSHLFTENYFHRFEVLCHQHNIKSYVEPYGLGPLNDLTVGGYCDIPMGEFWMDGRFMVSSAVQAAHVYGKPVISAESFTSWADLNWKAHPYVLKSAGDGGWARGINEFMFHRYAHQANPHVAPGMTMGNVGSHIDGTQTWWLNAGKAWMKYIQRGSHLLRQGVPKSDVLVYVGEGSPHAIPSRTDLKLPFGYNFDSCDTKVLMERLTVKDGKLVLPEGTTYSVLILRDCEQLSFSTLKRIGELARAGVPIIGKKPVEPFSYLDRQNKREVFKQLADEIWNTNNISEGDEWNHSIGISPDLTVKELPELEFMHRNVGQDDLYFIHNEEKVEKTLHCSFREAGRIPELWYADTGKTEKVAAFSQANGRTEVAVTLNPAGSVFVVFREPSAGIDPVAKVSPEGGRVILDSNNSMRLIADAAATYEITLDSGKTAKVEVAELKKPIPLDAAWRVEFDGPGLTSDKVVDFKFLSDWKDHERDDIKHFSGTAAYRTMLNVPADWLGEGKRFYLDLGRVEIAAEVVLNGKSAGILWKPPFVIDVTDQVVAGNNKLEVRVTNLWSNRLIGDESMKDTSGYSTGDTKKMPDWYMKNQPMPEGPRSTFTTYNFYRKDRALTPSGLLGPVVLKQEARVPLAK